MNAPNIIEDYAKFLLDNSKVDLDSGCRIWLGSDDGCYGVFYEKGKTVRAHRKSYEIFVEPIPIGYEPHHKCESKLCIEPDHLEILTRSEHLKKHRSRSLDGNCAKGHSLKEHGYIGKWKTGDIVLCRQCRREAENRDYKLGLREQWKKRRNEMK